MPKFKQKINNSLEFTKIWFWSLLFVFAFGIFSYGYCVHGMIANIVARQEMEKQISDLDYKVVALEAEYINIQDGITDDLAKGLGFVEANRQKFVTRKTDNPGLSLVTPGL